MIQESVNGKKWIQKSIEKLKNFLDRAPILANEIIGTENCQDGVFIVIIPFKNKLFFPFKYEVEPKAWVHEIKEELVKFYPRLIEDVVEEHILTPDEQALYVEKAGTIEGCPTKEDRIVKRNCWRIDKTLRYRDIFILYLEGTSSEDGQFVPSDNPVMRRFKYMGNSVLFLKKERELRAAHSDELADLNKDFFENAIPLDDVEVKNS